MLRKPGLLQTEGTPPEHAFNPAVKRSGWQAPEDSGLWKIADSVEQSVSSSAHVSASVDCLVQHERIYGPR